jgi:hypothetical protein
VVFFEGPCRYETLGVVLKPQPMSFDLNSENNDKVLL